MWFNFIVPPLQSSQPKKYYFSISGVLFQYFAGISVFFLPLTVKKHLSMDFILMILAFSLTSNLKFNMRHTNSSSGCGLTQPRGKMVRPNKEGSIAFSDSGC
jgi:hypothetical protein